MQCDVVVRCRVVVVSVRVCEFIVEYLSFSQLGQNTFELIEALIRFEWRSFQMNVADVNEICVIWKRMVVSALISNDLQDRDECSGSLFHIMQFEFVPFEQNDVAGGMMLTTSRIVLNCVRITVHVEKRAEIVIVNVRAK